MNEQINATIATDALIFSFLILMIVLLIKYVLYDKDFKLQLLMAEFNEDYEEVLAAVKICKPEDADKLIHAFKMRWVMVLEYGTVYDACRILEANKSLMVNFRNQNMN